MGKATDEVMEGYKETEIGVLPEDWEVVELGNVVSFTKKPRGLIVTESAIPFIPMDSIPNDGFFVKNYTLKLRKEITSGVYCEKGDILLARITPCFENGKQGILRDIPTHFAYATTEAYPLKPNPWKLDTLFLFHCLRQPDVRRQLAGKMEGATGRQRIPKSVLEAHLLPLPPLPEQRKIAHVLSTIQRAIELQDRVIAAVRELKRSLMRHLFTYGPVPVDQIDRVPLKETEIGPVPEHWEVVRLKEVAVFTRKPRGLECSGNIPFIPMELIPTGRVIIQDYVIKPSSEISSGVYCEQGDLLLAKITPSFENYKQGIVSRIPKPFAFATTEVYPIKARKDLLEILYLFYYLLIPQVRQDIAGKMEGTTGRQRVPKSVIQNYLIPIPPLSEQRHIAHILTTLDQKIEAEEKRKSTLQSLFQTMLHLLMTGKVRVKDLEVNIDAPGR